MTWRQLVNESKKYPTVYVTGCQRTGTTFCAKALAKEIGYNHIDEQEFNADNVDRFNTLNKKNAVIQCPALFHLFPSLGEGGLIVYIDRDMADVVKSMRECRWLQKYDEYESQKFSNLIIGTYFLKEEHYNKMRDQSNVVKINYEDLSNAEGYLTKEQREGFNIKQTEK